MDFKQIQELIKMINKSNIGEVSIEEKGFKVTIKQRVEPVHQIITQQASPQNYLPAAPQQSPQIEAPRQETKSAPAPEATQNTDNYQTIKSPMIGTFYRSAGPGKPTFIEPGDEVQPGKVVCIIEAMKLFNEIESELKGRIVKVLVEDASPVEFDQPLFLVDPA